MNKVEVEILVRKVLVEILGVDSQIESHLLSVAEIDKWDSLNHIIVISEIESLLHIQFDSEKISELTHFGSLVDESLSCLNNMLSNGL